jgi:hypothetical protein
VKNSAKALLLLVLIIPFCFRISRAQENAEQQAAQEPGAGQPPADEAGADPPAPARAAEGSGVAITLEEARLRLKKPAPYWEQMTPEELTEQAPGGCVPAQTPPNLLLVLNHRDAPVVLGVLRGGDTFLMRNRDDLEAYVDGLTQPIRQQLGEEAEIETEFSRRNGMPVHRVSFTASAGAAGGGCAPAQQGQQQELQFIIVDYFIRPADGDATYFRISCRGEDGAFEDVRNEVEFILASVEYTGDLAEDFFVPDAPDEKVPTAEQAAEAAGGGGETQWGWMLAAGMIVVIWFLLRKRGKKQAPEA